MNDEGHRGHCFDLQQIYNRVNGLYFEGKLKLSIRWVGDRDARPKRKVMFGSYHPDRKLIKIHRRLDQPHIPEYFISFVVYHEMLHHVLPPIVVRSAWYRFKRPKRKIHHPAFSRKERDFHEYDQVQLFKRAMKESWFQTMRSSS